MSISGARPRCVRICLDERAPSTDELDTGQPQPASAVTLPLLIVGTGLIGTSIGLAMADPAAVRLTDVDAGNLEIAVARGAGRAWDGLEPVGHVVLAVAPRLIARELKRLQDQRVGSTWSHVASSQAGVQAQIETIGCVTSNICGGHPMGGAEQSGPGAAHAELFAGRPWALCPSSSTTAEALAAVRALALQCGAEPVVLTAEEHDAAVAAVSHVPQVAASALAATLLLETSGGAEPVRLAGPGLRDTTRIAASDPGLWLDVLQQNAAAVAPLVHALAADLARAAAALSVLALGTPDPTQADPTQAEPLAVLEDLLRRGNAGRARVPVKRGEHDRDFARVAVAVPDRPGQIAGVLVSAAEAGINVEDVRVEHLAGRPSGVIELLVHAPTLQAARLALAAAGWDVLS